MSRTWERAVSVHDELVYSGAEPPHPQALFLTPDEVTRALNRRPHVVLRGEPSGDVVLDSEDPPSIDRDMGRLDAYLREGSATGQETLVLCDNDGQLQRLEEILGGAEHVPPGTRMGIGALEKGFVLTRSDPPLRVLNDHEIFRRARRLRRGRRFRGAASLESLAQLVPGDYVVHMDHGVGQFLRLEHIRVAGQELEALAIEYAGGEVLRLPVYRLDLVERWVGESEDARPPQVHRIGGKRWKSLRRRTERSIERMTHELLELYARRSTAAGFGFSACRR